MPIKWGLISIVVRIGNREQEELGVRAVVVWYT